MEDHNLEKAPNAFQPAKHTALLKDQEHLKLDLGSPGLRRQWSKISHSSQLPSSPPPASPRRRMIPSQTSSHKHSVELQSWNSGNDPQRGSRRDGNGNREAPGPALLGSFDYHTFLASGTGRKAQLSSSFTPTTSPSPASTSKHRSGVSMDVGKHRTPEAAIDLNETACKAPVETPTHWQKLKSKRSLPLLRRPSQRLKKRLEDVGSAPRLPLGHPSLQTQQLQNSPTQPGKRVQRLVGYLDWPNTFKTTPRKEGSSRQEPFSSPNAARALCASRSASPQRPLPRTPRLIATFPLVPLISVEGCPLSSRFIAHSQKTPTPRPPVNPATAMAPLNCSLKDSPALGSQPPTRGRALEDSPALCSKPPGRGTAGYISYKEIAPEKLKPFIGPLLPQQPPPTKPPPPPPTTRARQLNRSDSGQAKSKQVKETMLPCCPKDEFETMTPVKHSTSSIKSKASTAGRTDDSLEANLGQRSIKKMRVALRRKVSTLVGDDISTPLVSRATETDHGHTSTSTYRPISMNSLDPDGNPFPFSDIFDDVFNAARDSSSDYQRSAGPAPTPGHPCHSVESTQLRIGETAAREPVPSPSTIQTASRDAIAGRLAAKLGLTDPASRAAILAALAEMSQVAPPLTGHPAIRSDLPLQARLGMIQDATSGAGLRHIRGTPVAPDNSSTAAMAGLHVPPLSVGRQRPTQVAVSTRSASRSINAAVEPLTGFTTRSLVAVSDVAKGHEDVDPAPTFDRSVDVTWYRYADKSEQSCRRSTLPNMAKMFGTHSTVFMVLHARGRESGSTKYDHLRRFAYYDLDGSIRFRIMERLLEEYLPGRPVLLNHPRQASPAWPDGAFATLWDVLDPLQNILMACPRLRADVMTALLMTQPFHVIFSPFVKPITQPLPTKWFLKYVYFMQDVRVELDMTQLGFGPSWQATGLSTRLWDIGNLVHAFVEEMLRRDPDAHPMAQLTIHCRRFFGYRQGNNPHRDDEAFYKSPAGEHEEQKQSTQAAGQPWNYGRPSASLPPSARNPYSGHRRHHTGGPERVPFVHEGHMSVADQFHRLAGRVWSVRMVGMSEKWAMDVYKFWPKAEHDAVPKEKLGLHMDRYTPSRHSYAAPGHALFLDYGIRAGLHRFPPLPDSEPMVCAVYDDKNDVFLEVGSGNILTVKENGIDMIARSENPPIPRRDLSHRGGSPISLDGLTVAPSRIPGPVGRRVSPKRQAMRKGTPKKALQLLGFEDVDDFKAAPGTFRTLESEDDNDSSTPTMSRVPSAATQVLRRHVSMDGNIDNALLPELAFRNRRSDTALAIAPSILSSKKSYLGSMGSDRRKPTK